MNSYLDVRPEIANALAAGCPVIALESTVISHGLPRPHNLETASKMEAAVRDEGAMPIEPNAHRSPRDAAPQVFLDILYNLLPGLILPHHAYRQRSNSTIEIDVSPPGVLLPGR